MLRMKALDEAKSARALEAIERSARAQAQLIDDLLDISRIVAGKLRLEVRSVDLASVVEQGTRRQKRPDLTRHDVPKLHQFERVRRLLTYLPAGGGDRAIQRSPRCPTPGPTPLASA
jgi:signal transduction histidine kinase